MGKKTKNKKQKELPPIEVINGKTLVAHDWSPGPAMGIALGVAKTLDQLGMSAEAVFELLEDVRATPNDYLDGEYRELAKALAKPMIPEDRLRDVPVPYKIFGRELIESGAVDQLELATRLPVAVQAALMPDAHQGYGLPIGGVLAPKTRLFPML